MISLVLLGCPSPTPETGVPLETGAPPAPAELAVSPDTLDFGALPRGCSSAAQSVWIDNNGEAALTLTEATIDGSGSSAFDLTLPSGAIAGGSGAAVEVVFTPAALYDYALPLHILTDAGSAQVALLGSGIAGETRTDQATLVLEEQVDVLLLVDSTESMTEPLAVIDSAMDPFWSALTAEGASVHLGVLSMDMEEDAGRLLAMLTDADDAPTLPAPDSTATERGLSALLTALSEPLLSTENAGFRRTEAPLSVVVFSDEDDDSDLDLDTVAAWLAAEDGTVHAMVEARKPDQACQTEPGARYLELMDATGGLFISVCSADPAAPLAELARAILGISDTFSLTASPDSADGITVTRNGESIPQDLSDGWTLDSTEDTITLHGSAAPTVGDVLTFTYTATVCP